MSSQQQHETPTLLARTVDIVGEGNFPSGCSFSPDGLCVLTTTSSDNRLRLYNTPPLPQQYVPSATDQEDVENPSSVSAVTQWKTALHTKAGESVRSYCWYPLMNSSDPSSCAFLSASRDQPIHLIDAYTSAIRASYRPFNGLDELEAPNVVAFAPDGHRIFAAGFRTDRTIHVFRTDLPGRESDVLRLGKTRRSSDGQKGMVSAIAFPQYREPQHDERGAVGGVFGGYLSNPAIFAAGCYSPGSIYIYDDRMSSDDNPAGVILHGGICVVGHGKAFSRRKRRFVTMATGNGCTGNSSDDDDEGGNKGEEDIFSAAKVKWYQSRARGGITQLTWSPAGEHILYSASRRSDAVLAWDLRMLSGDTSRPIRGLRSYARDSDTNQRLEFCFDDIGESMFVASQDGTVKIYDVQSGKMTSSITPSLGDAVNGVSYKSTSAWGSRGGLLTVAVGARRFQSFDNEEDDSETDDKGVSSKRSEETKGAEKDNELLGESEKAPGCLEIYKVP